MIIFGVLTTSFHEKKKIWFSWIFRLPICYSKRIFYTICYFFHQIDLTDHKNRENSFFHFVDLNNKL